MINLNMGGGSSKKSRPIPAIVIATALLVALVGFLWVFSNDDYVTPRPQPAAGGQGTGGGSCNGGEGKDQLVQILKVNGLKFSEQNIVWIACVKGKVTWLEKGNQNAGLTHIVLRHIGDWRNAFGLTDGNAIAEVIKTTLLQETPIGTDKNAVLYNITANGRSHIVTIVTGSNGYIITAFPRRSP